MNTPGAAGTAGDGFRVPVREGRHRAAPPPPNPPTAAWWTVAVAAGALVVACVAAIAVDVAPKASAAGNGVQVPTVTRAQETAGPLETLSIGVVAPAVESLESTQENALSSPRSFPGVSVHAPALKTTAAGHSEVASPIETTSDSPELTVTPPPQPVSEDQPAEPTPTSPAPSTTDAPEEPPVTPTDSPTPSADVTVEVAP